MVFAVIVAVAGVGLLANSPVEVELAKGRSGVCSPDGKRIAFQCEKDGRFQVLVRNLENGREYPVEDRGHAAYPVWSADGSSLAYTYGADEGTAYEVAKGKRKPGGYGIRIWRDGKKTDVTKGRFRDSTPAFSPDGNRIWFSRNADIGKKLSDGTWKGGFCRSFIAVAAADGSTKEAEIVMEPKYGLSNSGFSQFSFSPDGKSAAWAAVDGYQNIWRVFVGEVAEDGRSIKEGSAKAVTPYGMFAFEPLWSPDGRYLAFSGYRDGDRGWQVFLLHVESRRVRRFARGRYAAFSPDMKAVLYGRDGAVFRRRLDPDDLPGPGCFLKIGYMDSLDFANVFDIETKEGNLKSLEHLLETGADAVCWRNQSGAFPRYPSAEDSRPDNEFPFNKLRLGMNSMYGWLRLDQGENMVDYALGECRKRGVVPGVHITFEENHWNSCFLGPWNLDHPEYMCRKFNGIPNPSRCSFAWPEVMEHKMRLFDEVLAMKPEMIVFDMFRGGCWTPAFEYVAPVKDEFRRTYSCEPPEDWKDERWMKVVSKFQHAYFREMRKRIERSGIKTRFILGIVYGDVADRATWERYALDWKELLKTDVIDGIAVQSVVPDPKNIWGSTRMIYATYARNVHNLGGHVYFPVSNYTLGDQFGYPRYAKELGITNEEAIAKLLDLAYSAGGDGIVMECVDYENYKPAERKLIREFKGGAK